MLRFARSTSDIDITLVALFNRLLKKTLKQRRKNVCLCRYHVTIASVSFVFVSTYLHGFMFLWVGILCYNFTIR